jgi:hypothetical protein
VANISNPGERRGVAWNEMLRVFDPLMRVSMKMYSPQTTRSSNTRQISLLQHLRTGLPKAAARMELPGVARQSVAFGLSGERCPPGRIQPGELV